MAMGYLTKVNMKEDPSRWKRLCELVKALATADIFVRAPSSVSAAGVPTVSAGTLQNRSIANVEGTVILSMSTLFLTSLEFPLLFGGEVIRTSSRGGTQLSVEDIEVHCDSLRKRLMKINTAMVYKQQKYNLLREETEGYSKLIVVLCMMPQSDSFVDLSSNVDSYIKNILSLIGQFDVDPNRVLDIVLDVFEQQPTNLSFIALLKHFPVRNIVHVLGFKFLYYQRSQSELQTTGEASNATPVSASGTSVVGGGTGAGAVSKSSSGPTAVPADKTAAPAPSAAKAAAPSGSKTTNSVVTGSSTAVVATVGSLNGSGLDFHHQTTSLPPPTPESLYSLSAVLILSEVVSLDDLLLYLQPSPEEVLADIQRRELALRKDILSFGVISLNSSSATPATSTSAATAEGLASAPVAEEIQANGGGNVTTSSGDKRPPPPPLPLPSTVTALAPTPAVVVKPPPPAYPPPNAVAAATKSGSASATQGKPSAESKVPVSCPFGYILQYLEFLSSKVRLSGCIF